mmetsp:Transcript_4758/g.11248  ORF Transcript_4758/g.11248 Transcript_4758/m.11248 type:complete len:449 (-) Transcript_4758:2503-3849(-)
MIPHFEPTKWYKIVDGIAGSSTKMAYRSKQAGIFKINQLVKNAHDLHKLDEKAQERSLLKQSSAVGQGSNDGSTSHKSSKAIALQNYADQVDELEEVGGLVWSVKEYFSGRMAGTEGIWLPSRLLAANAIQFFAIIICITSPSVTFRDLIEAIYPTTLPETVIFSESCFTTFDYDDCYFPFQDRGFYAGVGVCRDVSFEGPECYPLFQPLNGTDGLDGLIGSTCDSLLSAFAVVEAQVTDKLLGANCSDILGAAREFASEKAIDLDITEAEAVATINQCYGINSMTAEDIEKFNEWFTGDPRFPEITNETLSFCEDVRDLVKTDAFSELAPGFEDDAFEAFKMCMDAYGSIAMESPCKNSLFTPTEEIFAYEKNYGGEDDFCVSFISACYIDIYNPTRATCVIGESDDNLYQFQGPSCKNYPEIGNTLNYYEEVILPQQVSIMSFPFF